MKWATGQTPSVASLGAGVLRAMAHGLVGAHENRQAVSCYVSHLSWLNWFFFLISAIIFQEGTAVLRVCCWGSGWVPGVLSTQQRLVLVFRLLGAHLRTGTIELNLPESLIISYVFEESDVWKGACVTTPLWEYWTAGCQGRHTEGAETGFICSLLHVSTASHQSATLFAALLILAMNARVPPNNIFYSDNNNNVTIIIVILAADIGVFFVPDSILSPLQNPLLKHQIKTMS